jgi:glucose-1-phosphate thymidylyltransferase
VFGYYVNDPERCGVVEFDSNGVLVSKEENPEKPKSNYALDGLYFYINVAVEVAKTVKPLNRSELEITALNKTYLKRGNLKAQVLGRGFA